MELIESIESINESLVREFGKHEDDRPNFRVVFSEDQYEKRWTFYTDEGLELINPRVATLPKYKQWITAKYVLERLVPTGPESDLVEKTSYEPAWVFQDSKQNYLPPRFDACKIVIESLFEAMGKKDTHKKYTDPTETPEFKEARLKEMEQQLFGNETEIGDALAYGSGVGYTGKTLEEKIY